MSQGSCFYFQRLGWVTRSGGNSGSAPGGTGCERTRGRGRDWGHPEHPCNAGLMAVTSSQGERCPKLR